jgi:hypothetical protein
MLPGIVELRLNARLALARCFAAQAFFSASGTRGSMTTRPVPERGASTHIASIIDHKIGKFSCDSILRRKDWPWRGELGHEFGKIGLPALQWPHGI